MLTSRLRINAARRSFHLPVTSAILNVIIIPTEQTGAYHRMAERLETATNSVGESLKCNHFKKGLFIGWVNEAMCSNAPGCNSTTTKHL